MITTNNRPQAIIWDMDGVLVDTSDFHYEAWLETFQIFGREELNFSRAQFDAIFGMRNAETIAQLFGPALATPSFTAQVSEAKEALFRQHIRGQLKPLPGVRSWLEYWQAAGVKQAIASSAPQLNIEAILSEMEVEDSFQTIISAETPQVSRSKPAPDAFLEAARRFDLAPAACLVIEDAVIGVQAAKAAGMRCLGVTTTHSQADLAAADWTVATLAELPPEQVAAAWPTL